MMGVETTHGSSTYIHFGGANDVSRQRVAQLFVTRRHCHELVQIHGTVLVRPKSQHTVDAAQHITLSESIWSNSFCAFALSSSRVHLWSESGCEAGEHVRSRKAKACTLLGLEHAFYELVHL